MRSNQALIFELASFKSPDRLILTVQGPGVQPALSDFLAKHPLPKNLVRRYRVEHLDPDVVRLTLRLTRPLSSPAIYAVQAPDRSRQCLVLQLEQPSSGMTMVGCPPASTTLAAAAVRGSHLKESFLDVSINGQPMGTSLVLTDAHDHFWVGDDNLRQWRMVPAGRGVEHDGSSYHSIGQLPGAQVRFDPQAMCLNVHVGSEAFRRTVIHLRNASRTTPELPSYGMYLDYDVSAQRYAGHSGGGGLFRLNAFGPLGRFENTFLGRYGDGSASLLRLRSTFIHDDPSDMTTLRIGDAVTSATPWSRSVRFGGVQWGTNFATRPYMTTFPLANLHGQTALPSTVELYVNHALALKREIPAGPFSLQQLPVINGAGQITMVVRDALGREHTVQQPFYADAGLLREGLWAQSYALGFERRNYSLASNDYGRPLFVTTQRVGLSSRFTGELHVELLKHQQTIGLGGEWLLAPLGALSASAAVSHSADGQGHQVGVGLNRTGRVLSAGVHARFASRTFTLLGADPLHGVPSRSASGYISLAMPFTGSLSLSYTRRAYFNDAGLELLGLGYSQPLGAWGSLHASFTRFGGSAHGWMAGLSYIVPLGLRSSTSFDTQYQGGQWQNIAVLQRSVPAGQGIGYRVQAGMGRTTSGAAGLVANGEDATYTLDVGHDPTGNAVRAGIRGSAALLGGEVHLARDIQDSFAVVRVPGYGGVRVYDDNHLVAVTDRNGDALVPDLLAYQANHIRIDQADLPLDVGLGDTDAVVVPYAGTGVVQTFSVTRHHPLSVTLVRVDGGPVPAGGSATLAGRSGSYPIGFDGLLYLPDATLPTTVTARWPGGQCNARIKARPDAAGDPSPMKMTCR